MLELLHKQFKEQFNEQINKLNFNDIEYLLYVLNHIITINCIYILVKYKICYINPRWIDASKFRIYLP